MPSSKQSRRRFLKTLAGAGAALPLARFFGADVASAASTAADRIVFFYVPDGMHQADWGLSGRQWGALGARKQDCSLLTGVRMDDDTSQEGHPGGARRLLCGDAGYETSIDQFLATRLGATSLFPHLYLGVCASRQGTTRADEMISWKKGSSPTPEDHPVTAFSRIFPGGSTFASGSAPGAGGANAAPDEATLRTRVSVLDTVLADLMDLRSKLPASEQKKLDRHLEATREVERRVSALAEPATTSSSSPVVTADPAVVMACKDTRLDTRGIEAGSVFDPSRVPDVLSVQLDVLTQALACGATRVATLQCSHHTSELFMPFVPGEVKQQSHEASHNNQNIYLEQRVWWMGQFKAFLDRLSERPDPYVPGATLLDRTLVLFCTEINWGPLHRYTDMPFVLAGGQGAGLRRGGAFAIDAHHQRLHASLAAMLGTNVSGWRDAPERLSGLGG